MIASFWVMLFFGFTAGFKGGGVALLMEARLRNISLNLRSDPTRVRLVVNGIVQGVGFRPTVYRFARGLSLAGFVRNSAAGVVIELEGAAESIREFLGLLLKDPPPLSRIEKIETEELEPLGESGFRIEVSEDSGELDTLFPVDTATCGDCVREMWDPNDRRYRYPFINCTNCGPRFTIIESLPYDRAFTTMREFEMDEFCRLQYEDPLDRRFHAEPISCPDCGPQIKLVGADRKEISGDVIENAQRLISRGGIVAVKGLGGYHLACLAKDSEAVERLRKRKKRPAKPFALMFRDMDAVEKYCKVNDIERRLLLSPQAPIVLLKARDEHRLPDSIAPGNAYIGAFLPYTPLHHLLMEPFEVLVMTSANFTDEPLISTEEELASILGRIADAAIVHNRRIAHKCDDSIVFVSGDGVVPVRRARGYVPEPIPLVTEPRVDILALGGQVKGAFALSRGKKAFLSSHLGDLDDIRSQENFVRELESFRRLLKVDPEVCVHDMHPDYFTTRLARELGCRKLVAVQHHHAHAVSVMVEHGLRGPLVAVSFDGTGYGGDGTLWGGEFLLATTCEFKRLAHMKYVPLPGGEAAIKEPWRMALVYLRDAVGESEFRHSKLMERFFSSLPAGRVLELAERGLNSPLTSSIGRLFDAVAFLLGFTGRVSYEAEAAVFLESLALEGEAARDYEFRFLHGEVVVIDPSSVIKAVVRDIEKGINPGDIAASFHRAVAKMIVSMAGRLASGNRCGEVVLSGGVFQNRLLLRELGTLTRESNLDYYSHVVVPPNDGGISLGQLEIASSMMDEGLV